MGAPMNTAALVKIRLAAFPLFSELTEEELDLIAANVRSASHRKGARIFEEGAPADCCYVLTSGRAQVVLNTEGGEESLIADVMPGDLVGELGLIDGYARSAALVAVEASHFFVIPAAVFERLRQNSAFERRLLGRIAAMLRDRTDHVRTVSMAESITRVAWCLGRIATREGTRDGRIVIIPKKRHEDLARMAGCRRETVTRGLARLKRKKYVSWDARTMRLDVDGLQRMVRTGLIAGTREPVVRSAAAPHAVQLPRGG